MTHLCCERAHWLTSGWVHWCSESASQCCEYVCVLVWVTSAPVSIVGNKHPLSELPFYLLVNDQQHDSIKVESLTLEGKENIHNQLSKLVSNAYWMYINHTISDTENSFWLFANRYFFCNLVPVTLQNENWFACVLLTKSCFPSSFRSTVSRVCWI